MVLALHVYMYTITAITHTHTHTHTIALLLSLVSSNVTEIYMATATENSSVNETKNMYTYFINGFC